jgi:hypothetical protein
MKRLGHETDHSPPSSAESRMRKAVPPLPHTPSWLDAQLKRMDNFTFYIYHTLPPCFKIHFNIILLPTKPVTAMMMMMMMMMIMTLVIIN